MPSSPQHKPETLITNGSPVKQLFVSWDALEDAFENNAPEVHSYFHLQSGDVVRLVDGAGDYALEQRIRGDAAYVLIEPVSSREQYRWMERFIETTEDAAIQDHLLSAIDGKGAFRRFKDVLMEYPGERERWFTFRSERLRTCIETWLRNHNVVAVERPEWPVPAATNETTGATATNDSHEEEKLIESKPLAAPVAAPTVAVERTRSASTASTASTGSSAGLRQKAKDIIDALAVRELEFILSFLEFTLQRRSSVAQARSRARSPLRSGMMPVVRNEHDDLDNDAEEVSSLRPRASGDDD